MSPMSRARNVSQTTQFPTLTVIDITRVLCGIIAVEGLI